MKQVVFFVFFVRICENFSDEQMCPRCASNFSSIARLSGRKQALCNRPAILFPSLISSLDLSRPHPQRQPLTVTIVVDVNSSTIITFYLSITPSQPFVSDQRPPPVFATNIPFRLLTHSSHIFAFTKLNITNRQDVLQQLANYPPPKLNSSLTTRPHSPHHTLFLFLQVQQIIHQRHIV